MALMTIGYEGFKVETFFETLKEKGVKILVDIRELPLSRKPGFSKSALSKRASEMGIQYVHFSELGAPRDARHEYRDDENWDKFSERYKSYLKMQSDSVEKLANLVSKETCCLLCFEADYRRCHRRYVANAVYAQLDGELNIMHLTLAETTPAAWPRPLAGIVAPQ